MRFKPTHVLVGENSSYQLLDDAVNYYPHHCSWFVPKDAKQGETVLIIIGKSFVGEAVIRADAKPSDKVGEYVSTIGAIKLWEPEVPVDRIQRQISEWKYLTYTRSYATVPAEYQQQLLDAINAFFEEQKELETISLSAPINKPPKEVISIPSGESINMIEATGVHACPEEYPWSSYQEAQYMTFRHRGGAMKRLYKVEWWGVLPRLMEDLHLVPEEYRERVAQYIERREREWDFGGGVFRFYVLSTEKHLELLHQPRLARNIQGHCYFWLADLRSGEKIVQVASKSSGLAAPVRIPSLTQKVKEIDEEQSARPEETDEQILGSFDPDIFDPETLVEAREFQARQVVARRGQARFRQTLLEAYGRQCAFSSYNGEEALEAAHIVLYCGPDSDRVENGLLLRADLHTLFDKGLIVVDSSDPNALSLILAESLKGSSYKYLDGKPVKLPENVAHRPSIKALEWHRKQAGI